eukprot:SAG25_NODE_2414_length_1631_cov_3.442559_1_plen_76_part_00
MRPAQHHGPTTQQLQLLLLLLLAGQRLIAPLLLAGHVMGRHRGRGGVQDRTPRPVAEGARLRAREVNATLLRRRG